MHPEAVGRTQALDARTREIIALQIEPDALAPLE
jgi:hypothetical protein